MLIDDLRGVRNKEETYNRDIQVDDVIYMGRATIGKDEEEREVNVYQVIEGKTIKYYFDNDCVAYETLNVGKGEPAIIPSPEYLKEYEEGTPIKDIIVNLKQKQMEEQAKTRDEEKEMVSLNELEQELDRKDENGKEEQDKTKKKEEEIKSKEKRKPSHVIEVIEPDKAKMDYWKNVKQAFGLPDKVHTVAFAYPTSKEDKVDYANITVYMLDKDGYIIDDLKVDDYFEFDSSTGNNPINDDTVRFEEDENKGKAQLEENNTMIRLKAKNSQDQNTYISLEQKNHVGDNHDINAGRKIVGGTQNVEKQLETNKLRVWDSDRERLVNGRAGIYNMNHIYEEADKHKDHGDEEYIKKENADGKDYTVEMCESPIIPGTDKTWEELAEETGESITKLQDRFERELEDGKKPEDILEKIEYDYEMVEHNRDRR